MSDRRTRYLIITAFALVISACSRDDNAGGAGAGAGTSASGGQGGEAAANAGSSASGGTEAGAGGTSAGTSAGTTAGAGGAGGMTGGTMAGTGGRDAGTDGGAKDAGIDSGSDAGPDLEGCVVGKRINECCPAWIAVTRAEAYADPCLLAVGEPVRSVEGGLGCAPDICPAVVCPDTPPPSRVAEPFGANGECVFVDECHAEASCEVGTDMTSCCPCPGSLPQQLIDREPCVLGVNETANDLPAGCYKPCPVECDVCPGFSPPVCAVGDAISACL